MQSEVLSADHLPLHAGKQVFQFYLILNASLDGYMLSIIFFW